MAPFADKVGTVPLTDDATFKDLLKKSRKRRCGYAKGAGRIFDNPYCKPALKWATDNGFILSLSALVIYDSFIHRGSILWVIRGMVPKSPPNSGGNETELVTAYVEARHVWLATHHREAVRKTIYRTQCFRNEIERGNWTLGALPINANGTMVS